jgi:hypothetical protein
VSIDDRIRTATEATAATVREIRPLELPADLPARLRGRRRPRRWLTWGSPLAAAALVTAVALILVALRQVQVPLAGPAAPARPPAVPASVPRYYVALGTGTAAVVGDDRTGRTLAHVSPPAGQSFFTGVTAAADDRTFVLSSGQSATRLTTFYLLRITPGAANPAQLTKLFIKPLLAQPSGLALSQDGRELAVMFAGSSLQLWTYSVLSGALLGAWHTDTAYWMLRTGGANAYGLSWSADGRHIAFRFDAYGRNSASHLVTVRTLDLTAGGDDLLGESRPVLQVPLSTAGWSNTSTEPCFTSLAAADGSAVVCGAADTSGTSSGSACASAPAAFTRYPAQTGKLPQLLYQYAGQCGSGVAVPLWTDSAGRSVIGLMLVARPGKTTDMFGLFAGGRFVPLPALPALPYLPGGPASQSGLTDPGYIAF